MSDIQLRTRLDGDILHFTRVRGLYTLVSIFLTALELSFSAIAIAYIGVGRTDEAGLFTMLNALAVTADNAIGSRERATSVHITINGLKTIRSRLALPPSSNQLWDEYFDVTRDVPIDYVGAIVALCIV